MRKIVIGIIIGLAAIFVMFVMGMCASLLNKKSPFKGDGDIALVKITGTITTSDGTIDKLEDARLDDSVKAVLLRIDSPGGAVAASQEIFEEVKKVNKKKPVVVSMGDVAASGGYYIACGASKIFANKGTITGSIGVRMEHVNIKDLLSFAKLSHETLKSGEMKDVGAIDRELSEKDREFLQSILVAMHKQFKQDVAEARKIAPEKIDEIADGRIYTGEQALDLGLIDQIGGISVAIDETAKMAGIKGEPVLKKYEEEMPWWISLFLNKASALTEKLSFKF